MLPCSRTSWYAAGTLRSIMDKAVPPDKSVQRESLSSADAERARKKERGHPVRSRARTTQAFQQRTPLDTPLGRDSSAPLSTCRVIPFAYSRCSCHVACVASRCSLVSFLPSARGNSMLRITSRSHSVARARSWAPWALPSSDRAGSVPRVHSAPWRPSVSARRF